MSLTLADLAIHIPASIRLFEKYDFDYYQNGKQTFKEACQEKGLSFSEIDAELNCLQNESKETYPLTLEDMSIDTLIDFINGQYHSSEAEVLNFIHSNIQKLINDENCGGLLLNLLKDIEQKFRELMVKLIQHCEKEDQILFPYIRKLFELCRHKSEISSSRSISIIKNPIRMLEEEHVQAANILSELKKATDNFTAPLSSPKEYATLMERMKEFEKELHMHLHIENNILFPKLIVLEEQLNSQLR